MRFRENFLNDALKVPEINMATIHNEFFGIMYELMGKYNQARIASYKNAVKNSLGHEEC